MAAHLHPAMAAASKRRARRASSKRPKTSDLPTGYLRLTYRSIVDDSDQPFALWVPPTYSPRRQYPLIVVMHGTDADERMIPEECLRIHERGFLDNVLLLSPFGRGDLWYRGAGERDFWDAILWVKARYRVDTRRQYLTGLSMGGYACWRLGSLYADQWAAIAPVCGGGDPAAAGRLRHVPVWCVHGVKDPVVPVEESRRMVQELRRCHGECRYDELQGWGHEAWRWLYDPNRHEDSLPSWFLNHRRDSPAPALKRPRRHGDFEDLFTDRLIVSYPAHTSIPHEAELLREEAENLARFQFGDLVMRAGRLMVREDRSLAAGDLKGANHLMLGRSDNHAALRSAARRLAVRHIHGRLQVGTRSYLGKGLVVASCQRSPWNSRRLLGIITYQQAHQMRGLLAHWFHPEAHLRALNIYDLQQRRFILQE